MSLIDITRLVRHSFSNGGPRITPVSSLYKFHTTVDVLRLDEIHPVISGNKWYKLKEYLTDAHSQQKKIILTFGGAWSNHIIATAAAASLSGFKSIGIIRGEEPKTLSATLLNAQQLGMELFFVSRGDYQLKTIPGSVLKHYHPSELYQINEGGYGEKGAKGASHIMDAVDQEQYDHILAAVGTGTMLAGLISCTSHSTRVTGIPVLKHPGLKSEINFLLDNDKQDAYSLVEGYEFGGYAKKNEHLISFMNTWYEQTGIPSDFVYTGKLFYAAAHLIEQGFFPSKARILIIHSGGLQGNSSLSKGTLIF